MKKQYLCNGFENALRAAEIISRRLEQKLPAPVKKGTPPRPSQMEEEFSIFLNS